MCCFVRLGSRSRRRTLTLIIGVVIVGLPTRLVPESMPGFMVQYGGDVLWALLIYLVLRLILPSALGRKVAVMALAAAWGIEISQLYQADWVNVIRNVKLSGLILGYTFLWSDVFCYLCGVGAGLLVERVALPSHNKGEAPS